MTIGQRAASPPRKRLFARHIAVPNEHGSWVFLFSPLIIGLALGGALTPASLALILAALAAFMLRQPVTIAVKVLSGRRPAGDLITARLWMGVYGLFLLAAVAALVLLGAGYVIMLAAPALPVLGWHLWLVSRRAERRQVWVEIAGAGALALAAPAAYWVGQGGYQPLGWLLWAVCWLQAAGSIVYAYLRLEQRKLTAVPDRAEQWRMARPAVLVNAGILIGVALLAAAGRIPFLAPLAFTLQPLETLWGAAHPAVRVKPAIIGLRQLAVSSLFTVLFVALWLAG